MGITKQIMESEQMKRDTALEIALDSGAIKQCEFHEDILYEGSSDYKKAYRLGNSRYSSSGYSDVFKNRLEMTDLIKEIIDEYFEGECYACAKWRRE